MKNASQMLAGHANNTLLWNGRTLTFALTSKDKTPSELYVSENKINSVLTL